MELDAPKPPKSKRRWYVRHLLTCVVLVVVGGALVTANALGHFTGGSGCSDQWPDLSFHGWPNFCVSRWEYSECTYYLPTSPVTWRVISVVSYSVTDTLWLVTNVVVALAILGCTAAVCERFRRNWTGRPQFRLATLLWLTAVAAALLALLRIEQSSQPGLGYNPTVWQPLWIRVPLLFGIGCTVYVAGQIGVWIVGRTVAKVARMLRTQ